MGGLRQIDYLKFIGRQIGNVTIVKELGHGAMGVVFIGYQASLKRQVAVKVLPKAAVRSTASQVRFRDEAEMVAILSHPNIIPIFEMGEEDEFYYQVMQLVKGVDLQSMIYTALKHPVPARRIIPFERTLDIIGQVLDGLQYAHEEQVVHQDIKPANILMEERTGRPLIADFGIAKTAQAEARSQGTIAGTPLYMSPEQAAGKPTDGRTDIFSTGVIFFEMIAGVLPVVKEHAMQILMRKTRDPASIFTRTPSQACRAPISAEAKGDLERIILRALAPDIERRYGCCRVFREELEVFKDRWFPRGRTKAEGAS